MKTITSKLSVLAMVCGVGMAAFGCSSEPGQDPNNNDIITAPQGLSNLKGYVSDEGPEDYTKFGLAGKGTQAATDVVVVSVLKADGKLEELTKVKSCDQPSMGVICHRFEELKKDIDSADSETPIDSLITRVRYMSASIAAKKVQR